MNCPKCGASLVAGSEFCSGCGLQVATAAAAAPAKKSNTAKVIIIIAVVGFVGIFVFGIIAAIAIPSMLMSVQRGKQKRTMGDMKTIAYAIEQYNTDNRHFPTASNIFELCNALMPDYLATCIHKDGWWTQQNGRHFAYIAWEGTPEGCMAAPSDNAAAPSPDSEEHPCGPHHYVLASAGKDGIFEQQDWRDYDRRETSSFNDDIVIRDGEFIREPVGKQHNR